MKIKNKQGRPQAENKKKARNISMSDEVWNKAEEIGLFVKAIDSKNQNKLHSPGIEFAVDKVWNILINESKDGKN